MGSIESSPHTGRVEVTVVICTRGRPYSLIQTLNCLAESANNSCRFEVLVVVNADKDETIQHLLHASYPFKVRHLQEGRKGKGYALNCAMNAKPEGEIIAVIDDDMSPEPGWIEGVVSICKQWPNHSLFTGTSYVIWPEVAIPPFCRHPNLLGWAFSVMAVGKEKTLPYGRWFSGNHYWFRKSAISTAKPFSTSDTFPDAQMYATEPQFMLDLTESGHRGLMTPIVRCGHRIQPTLLDYHNLARRADLVGKGFAIARMLPPRATSKQSRLFKAYPILAQMFCIASMVGWSAGVLISYPASLHPSVIVFRLHAIQRFATYKTYLEIAARSEHYKVSQ